MKKVIMQAIKEILALNSPVNPADVKQILLKIDFQQEGVPEELVSYFALLSKLSIYAQQHEELTNEIKDIEQKKATYEILLKQIEKVRLEFNTLEQEVESAKVQTNLFYKTLEPQARKFVPSMSNAPVINEYGETQKSLIKLYHTSLQQAFQDSVLSKSKLEFVYKVDLIEKLLTQLTDKDIKLHIKEDADSYERYLQELSEDTQRLTKLKLRWSGNKEAAEKKAGLQYRFVQEISLEDIQSKEKEIVSNIALIEKQLEGIPALLQSNELGSEEKSSLSESFKTSPDTPALIKGYQDQIDGVTSYISPTKWWNWSVNTNYNKDQKRLKDSVQFLQLLEQQKALGRERAEQVKQRELILDLIPDQNSKSSDTSITLLPISNQRNGLLCDASDLINDLPPFDSPMQLSPDSPLTDFYLVLLSQMPFIIEKEERNLLIVSLLKELIPLKREVERLITQHGLKLPIDSQYPSIEEARQAKDSFGQPDQQQAELVEQHKQCEIYFSMAKKLDGFLLAMKDTTARAKELAKQLREISYSPDSASSLLQTPGHLISLAQRMEQTISDLKKLPGLEVDKSEHKPPEDIKPSPITQATSVEGEKPNDGIALQQAPKETLHPIPDLTALQKEKPTVETPVEKQIQDLSSTELLHAPQSVSSLETTDKELHVSSSVQPIQTNGFEETALLQVNTEQKKSYPPDSVSEYRLFPTNSLMANTGPQTPVELVEKPSPILELPAQTTLISAALPESQKIASESEESTEVFYPSQEEEEEQTNSDELEDQSSHSGEEDEYPKETISVSQSAYDPLLRKAAIIIHSLKERDLNELIATPTIEGNSVRLLSFYHDLNLTLISHHSSDIQTWYQQLYSAIQSASLGTNESLQAIHLLKDILFELQYQHDMRTLNAYMRICPYPASDFQKLLKFKPAVATPETETDEQTIFDNCPTELNKFYDQYLRLKESYPIEAKLFLQAINSFVLIKESISSCKDKSNLGNIPRLTEDPRFEPLKRHRGFLKLWEVFEDIFNWIVGNIKGRPEHEYTNRPCFFRTQSNKLLEEADEMTQKMLSDPEKGTVVSP